MKARTEMIKILDEEIGGTVTLAILQDLADRLLEIDISHCPLCGGEIKREALEYRTDQDKQKE